jgi:hypothetical protein
LNSLSYVKVVGITCFETLSDAWSAPASRSIRWNDHSSVSSGFEGQKAATKRPKLTGKLVACIVDHGAVYPVSYLINLIKK